MKKQIPIILILEENHEFGYSDKNATACFSLWNQSVTDPSSD